MIRVPYLARVEGEGEFEVRIQDGRVRETHFGIFEPPRFFEAFLRGRNFNDLPDIVARICGICPVAYQMSACHAVEDACGVRVEGSLRDLRRLIYCGEWIESHALHVLLLHAPDFLGYEDGFAMARDHGEIVKRGLAVKKAGNAIVTLIGGREIHPVAVRVGGFSHVPSKRELEPLAEQLKRARDDARALVAWTAKLPMPDVEHDYEFVSLRHPREYPMNEGRIVSTSGFDISVRDYETHFTESQAPYSTALRSDMTGRAGAYFVGPLARYNLNFDRLSPIAQEAAREAGLGPASRNPYHSIIVRAVEILYACDEALRIIDAYEPPDAPKVAIHPCARTGHGCTEAPRGSLYHHYRIDEHGDILDARIVPPTSQNQKSIEEDLVRFVEPRTDWSDDKLRAGCEQAIRNYDPCISCSTHLLKVKIVR